MPPDPSSKTPLRVLIAGAGVGGLETAVALRSLAGDRVHLRMLAPDGCFTWRALQIGEPFGGEHVHRYPLAGLADALAMDLVSDTLVAVDGERRVVRSGSGPELGYDVLVLAVGAVALPVLESAGTIDRAGSPEVFEEALDALRAGLAESLLVVVPDGVAWSLPAYELAILAAAGTAADVTLTTGERRPLNLFGTDPSRAVAAALHAAGVTVRTGVRTDVVSPTAARVDGAWMHADRIVALPGFDGPAVPGLPADPLGFVLTDDDHRVVGLEGTVYAVGDGAGGPIKHGGLTARAADRVAAAIARSTGRRVRADEGGPILRGLLQTPDGPLFLSADLRDPDGTGTASRSALWWPPTKVAAPWLASFITDLDARRLVGPGTVPGG